MNDEIKINYIPHRLFLKMDEEETKFVWNLHKENEDLKRYLRVVSRINVNLKRIDEAVGVIKQLIKDGE